jgi:uncharacterized protein YecE (DUF72 family)
VAREFLVGTSGWHYGHWRGLFYPEGLPARRWFEVYRRHFQTVEINASFYRQPRESTWRLWSEQAPEGFLYAVKASRYLTHLRRLKDPEEPLSRFLQGALLLGPHLGPLLYQLPPNMPCDLSRLQHFLSILPSGLDHAMEFRHDSWFSAEVYALLRRYGVAFCIYHRGDFCTPLQVTAPFAYVRFHGTNLSYGGEYGTELIKEWAGLLEGLPVQRVYIYFNNDVGGAAVRDARLLQQLLGVRVGG